VQSLVPVHEIANAVGAMTISQDLGMVLFLAISGSLFHNVAVDKVGKALPEVSPTDIGNLIAGSSSKAFQALSEEEKALVIPEIASAMTSIWAFFLAAAALSVVCSVPLLVSSLQDLPSFRRTLFTDVHDRKPTSVMGRKVLRSLQHEMHRYCKCTCQARGIDSIGGGFHFNMYFPLHYQNSKSRSIRCVICFIAMISEYLEYTAPTACMSSMI